MARANRPDFGTYRTLVLHVDDEPDEAVQAYAEALGNGIESWLEACFTPPVTYTGPIATMPWRDPGELVVASLLTLRLNPDGAFAIPDFEAVDTNLSAAFPEHSEAARLQLANN